MTQAAQIFDLTGKVAMVTGASRGIGRQLALTLAENGSDLIINARNEDALTQVASEAEAMGRKVVKVVGDVTQPETVDALLEASKEHFDQLDILINNAGIWEGSYLVRLKKEQWDRVLDVNMTGPFMLAQSVAKKMMKQRSGKIINLASILGLKANPQALVYCATKAAIVQMTKVMAIELGPAGIQVNALAPGFVLTDMTDRYQDQAEALEQYVAKIPARRYAQTEDLEGAVLFLASAASNHVNGHILVVDGGESLV